MNRKDISEIKKQLNPDRCCLTRICGCYVDAEKQRKTELSQIFLSLAEEEMFKYFDILRKTLSGTVGRNLLSMEFPLEAEAEGSQHEFLRKLVKSRLTDDTLLDAFYQQVIEKFDYAENYYIILVHGVYDIPGKATDGMEMFDASDEVYEHIICSICPVNLSRAGLCYNTETNAIEDRIRDWIVEMPETGFLFPAFTDRGSNLHEILYYAKKAEKSHSEFAYDLLGCTPPLSPTGQKDSFNALVEETLGEACSYETVVNIHEKLSELIENAKEEPDPVILTKSEVRRVLEESGADEEHLSSFDETYDTTAGENTALMAANITNAKTMEIESSEIKVRVSPEQSKLIETRVIDGRKCLVIPLDGEVTVNGIAVRV